MTEKDFKQIFPLGEKNDAYTLPLKAHGRNALSG